MNRSHLVDLRQELSRRGVDGFIVPRADEHLGEYVPACAERLAWLTGFTGSAGVAAVLPDKAAVFTDGRYVLQLAAQTEAADWEQLHITDSPPPGWLTANTPEGARIGFDPMLMSEEALRRYTDAGLAMVPLDGNPIDAVWVDRPAPPADPAEPHGLEFAGQPSEQKRQEIAEGLVMAGQDAAVLTDPASIAWLLNIRGADLGTTPVALGFAILHADARCDLFMAPEKLPAETRAWLGNSVVVQDRAALEGALRGLAGKRVRVDPSGAPVWFARVLREAGAEVAAGPDPCLLPKARKNAVERQGARDAHVWDAVAVCRFLHWMESAAGRATELSAAAQLLAFRRQQAGFRGESFSAISGAGEHGAVIHYRVTPETDRPIGVNEVYLIDSGGQYRDGTTDVTRTVWTGPGLPPATLRERFTRVLKGHIAIATLVFPQGTAGPHIDALARVALWQVGLDFDHGTGHGVGSYLSVHEGPAGISRRGGSVPIEAGMILSNEPGFYAPGEYGIRLENLELAVAAELPKAAKPFLRFEALTLAPFDRRMLEPSLLTAAETAWLGRYHARVLREIGPHLDGEAAGWLRRVCA